MNRDGVCQGHFVQFTEIVADQPIVEADGNLTLDGSMDSMA
jgi:hypothetical protein